MKNLTCALFLLLLTGCATIISGTHQTVSFTSSPAGATVHVNGYIAITPATMSLKRGGGYQVRFRLAGYVDKTVELKSIDNWWLVGNAIFGLGGLLIGAPIDILSGAWKWLDKDSVSVILEKSNAPWWSIKT